MSEIHFDTKIYNISMALLNCEFINICVFHSNHALHTIIPSPGLYSLTKTWLGNLPSNTPNSPIFCPYTLSH